MPPAPRLYFYQSTCRIVIGLPAPIAIRSGSARELEAVRKEMTPHVFPKAYWEYPDRFEANRGNLDFLDADYR